MLLDLKKSRYLAYAFAKRDISAMYRQSIFGVLWAFIIPLINSTIWIFLNSSGVINMQEIAGMNYPLYVFTGTMMWQIFVEALQSPIQEVTNARGVLAKLNFPRESVLLSGLYKTFFNAGIKLIILIPVIFIFQSSISWTIIFFPIVIIGIILVGSAIGVLLAPIGALFKDIGQIIPFVGQLLMFFAPVVFVLPKSGDTLILFNMNIMTPLLMTGRDLITNTGFDWVLYSVFVVIGALMALTIGWTIFRKAMPIIIERLN